MGSAVLSRSIFKRWAAVSWRVARTWLAIGKAGDEGSSVELEADSAYFPQNKHQNKTCPSLAASFEVKRSSDGDAIEFVRWGAGLQSTRRDKRETSKHCMACILWLPMPEREQNTFLISLRGILSICESVLVSGCHNRHYIWLLSRAHAISQVPAC